MSKHHRGKFGNKINPWDLNSQELTPQEFLQRLPTLEEKLRNIHISSQPNHQPNHDAADPYEAEGITAPEHNPIYQTLHRAQEYLLRGLDGLITIITKPFTYKPLREATLITTGLLTLTGTSAAAAYFHQRQDESKIEVAATIPENYELNGKRLVFGDKQDNFFPYNSQITLQPAPKSAYLAQTGDNSNGAVTGDGSNPPIEFPCMPPEVLDNAPFPPPGVSICETADITTLAAQTGDIPVPLPLRINLGDYPIGQPVTVKLFSTGDDVLTGDAIYTFTGIPIMSGDGIADLLLPAVTGDRLYNVTVQGQNTPKNLVTRINKIPYVIAYSDGVDPIYVGMLERIVLTGDVTQDRRVNSKDLRHITKKLGSNDPDADLNQDGIVDAHDLALVAIDFGKQQQIHVQPVPPPQDFSFDLNATINDLVTGYNLETPENIKLFKALNYTLHQTVGINLQQWIYDGKLRGIYFRDQQPRRAVAEVDFEEKIVNKVRRYVAGTIYYNSTSELFQQAFASLTKEPFWLKLFLEDFADHDVDVPGTGIADESYTFTGEALTHYWLMVNKGYKLSLEDTEQNKHILKVLIPDSWDNFPAFGDLQKSMWYEAANNPNWRQELINNKFLTDKTLKNELLPFWENIVRTAPIYRGYQNYTTGDKAFASSILVQRVEVGGLERPFTPTQLY